jgi:glycolate oxidase FAD binding subunit
MIGSLRDGTAADAIDGVVPRHVVDPDDAKELADLLAWAARERLPTVVQGGGSKLGWGRMPGAVGLVIRTARLNRVVAHRHGDLTVTVQSGTRLTDLEAVLARRGQRLPLDSPFDEATIGGVLATNDAGPLRHRHGTPRDQLIGVTLATTSGRLVKAGGNVVKNVAGYDLGRLVCGSFGTLAVVVDATFKLMPLAAATSTLVANYVDEAALARDAGAIAAGSLEPECCDVRVESEDAGRVVFRLLLRFASSPAATDSQIAAARALMSGGSPTREAPDPEGKGAVTVVTAERERLLWSGQLRAPWLAPGMVIRFSWLPARLGDVLSVVRGMYEEAGGAVIFSGRVGAGAGVLRVDADLSTQVALVARLRSSPHVGHVVVLRASRELKEQIDVWGEPAASFRISQALKRALDPAGILNAGRGPV